MATTKMTFIGSNVPKDLAERIQKLAEQNGHTVGGEIRRALRNHLASEAERQERLSVPDSG